jgi:hypothetical protein
LFEKAALRLLNAAKQHLYFQDYYVTSIGEKVEIMQFLWVQAAIFLTMVEWGQSQVQYTIDAKIDNNFFHELISPSIANSNTKQNMYSRFGAKYNIVNQLKKLVTIFQVPLSVWRLI